MDPRTPSPVSPRNLTADNNEQREFMRQERNRLFASGAWEPATCAQFVSRVHVVPKPNGRGYRVVQDLRHLNTHCVKTPIKYETLARVPKLLRKGDWMFQWDILDGYHHVAIAPQYRKYFVFQFEGEYIQCAALPFGWSDSPRIFVKTMRPLMQYLRSPLGPGARLGETEPSRRGLRAMSYVDDFWATEATRELARTASAWVQSVLQMLGVTWHPDKSIWEPTQFLVLLGIEVNSAQGVFRSPPPRLNRLQQMAREIACDAISHQRRTPACKMASFVGLAQSCYLALPETRFFLRELHDVLNTRASWGGTVVLSKQALRDLRWWASCGTVAQQGAAIWRQRQTADLWTDASDTAWGGATNANPAVECSASCCVRVVFGPLHSAQPPYKCAS